jgi:CubicO group peptidase (beta-lactamase class C family)
MLRLRLLSSVFLLCTFFAGQAAFVQVPAPTKTVPSSTAAANSAPATPATPAAQLHALTTADLESFFDGIIPLQLERSDVAGATVLVMKDGQTLLKKGYGYSDFKNKKPVNPNSTIFRLASISKLFTWTSVMQLAEQGKVDVDADINQYLDFKIAPGFGKPITLRNLMTHTGGFEEEVRDIIITDPKMGSSLRDFLMHNQPRRIFPPGEISAYSNYGVGLGGYIVQRVSGEPFEQYVAEHIFQPLGMTHSSFHQPLENEITAFPSDGYKSSTEKPAVGFEIFNPAPAGGISSTALDMGRFAQALLNGGELDGHRILKQETLNAMWTRQFAASDGLPAICMGFYQTWRNGLHFIGHDGDLIAFHSMFVVELKEKLAIFISYNSAGSASKTRGEILNSFTDRYYPFTPAPAFQTFPLQDLKAIEGTYQPTRRSESNKLKIGGLMSQNTASVDKDGVLTIENAKDLRGHLRKFKPIGTDLWQAVDDQPRVFAIRDSSGKVMRFASMFAGSQYERVPWYENAQALEFILGGAFLTLLLTVVATLVRLGRKLFFSKRAQLRPQPGTLWLTAGPRLAAFAWIILGITTGVLLSSLDSENTLPSHALDKYFVLLNVLAAIAVFFSLFAIGSGALIWRRENLRTITRVKFSLVALSCLFLTWFAIHWNILGPAHRF